MTMGRVWSREGRRLSEKEACPREGETLFCGTEEVICGPIETGREKRRKKGVLEFCAIARGKKRGFRSDEYSGLRRRAHLFRGTRRKSSRLNIAQNDAKRKVDTHKKCGCLLLCDRMRKLEFRFFLCALSERIHPPRYRRLKRSFLPSLIH